MDGCHLSKNVFENSPFRTLWVWILLFTFVFVNSIAIPSAPKTLNHRNITTTGRISLIPTFVSPLPSSILRSQPLNSGWGTCERYSWKEDDEKIHLVTVVDRHLTPQDFNIHIKADSILVEQRDKLLPILSGKTKGKIDIDDTIWVLEDKANRKELQITIKKGDPIPKTWFGVIVGDVGKVFYDQLQPEQKPLELQSLEPGQVFWSKTFSGLSGERLAEMFKRWISRKSDPLVPYGKPQNELEFHLKPEDSGGKLIFAGLDIDDDEYFDVYITVENSDSTLVLVNSPTTKILKGEYGTEASDKLKRSMAKLLYTFESDVEKLTILLAKENEPSKDTFDYAGSNAIIGPSTLDDYMKYHKGLRARMGKRTYKNEADNAIKEGIYKNNEDGILIDWDTPVDPNASRQENIDHKKKLLNKLTEAIKHTTNQQPLETVKSLVSNLRQHLSLTDEEFDQLIQSASSRVSQENDLLDTKQEETSNMDITNYPDPVFNYLASEIVKDNKDSDQKKESEIDTFDHVMHLKEHYLSRRYHKLGDYEKKQLRQRWKLGEKRLKLLIHELFQSTSVMEPVICNNYRDLLISEDYPTLMKSFVDWNAPFTREHRFKLTFLNEFVLSLYKDMEIYTCMDEKKQLAKIKQICEWAQNDFEKINDLVAANKHLYDRNFLTYLRLGISKEVENMRATHGYSDDFVPKPQHNPWLCILTIIERAITSLIEADMTEDVYHIGLIIQQERPQVRSYMLEFFLATMPRSDWKSFKDLVLAIANSLLRRPIQERKIEELPEWFQGACIQLKDDIEKIIPDWVIDGMLSPDDRKFMYINNKKKTPILQLDLRYLDKEFMEPGEMGMHMQAAQLFKMPPSPFDQKCQWPIESQILQLCNPFELFNLPLAYNVDKQQLSQVFKNIQFQLHPDRHAAKCDEELATISSNSSLLNVKYKMLLDDKQRAKLLFCLEFGTEHFEREINNSDPEQLEEVFEVHEKIANLENPAEIANLRNAYQDKITNVVHTLDQAFKNKDPDQVLKLYRSLSFYQQIHHEIDNKLKNDNNN